MTEKKQAVTVLLTLMMLVSAATSFGQAQVKTEEKSSMKQPARVKILEVYGRAGGYGELTMRWKPAEGASGYEQQVNRMKNGKWTGWKSFVYDEDGKKQKFINYDTTLKLLKRRYPDGYVEIMKKDGSGFRHCSVKKAAEYIIGRRAARLKVVEDLSVYRFRVRAYRMVKGKKVYGAWSRPAEAKKTIDLKSLKKILRDYAVKYAEKQNLNFIYLDEADGNDENSSYILEGTLGAFSRYARQEDVIKKLKAEIRFYIDRTGETEENRGFLYIKKSKPGQMEGMELHTSKDIYYTAWMLRG